MQRNHLIVGVVVVVALIACCCTSAVVGLMFWPITSTTADGPTPRERVTPSEALDEIELLPGVWRCAQGNERVPAGSAYQFLPPHSGRTGTVYLTSDPSSGEDWIEGEYELGEAGFLVISPVSYSIWAVTSSYAIEFSDADTMRMRSMGAGDENMATAVMVRVE